ncbi:hypothetical protein THAOC_23393, partial [Thalassiosira oceanica]
NGTVDMVSTKVCSRDVFVVLEVVKWTRLLGGGSSSKMDCWAATKLSKRASWEILGQILTEDGRAGEGFLARRRLSEESNAAPSSSKAWQQCKTTHAIQDFTIRQTVLIGLGLVQPSA